MAALAAARRPGSARDAATIGAIGAAALLVGAAGVAAAYWVHPLLGPALVIGAAVFAITISRPEVGLAAWFVMIPAGELGVTGRPHWLLPSVWAALLCGLAAARAAADDEPAPPLVLPVLCFSALTVVQGLALTAPTSAALASI